MGNALEKRLAQLDRTRRAAEVLRGAMRPVAALDGYELSEALAIKPDAVVFRAHRAGETVVIKQFLEADAARIVSRMAEELDTGAAHLTDPRFSINRCLLALPQEGLILLSDVPGRRLRDCLAEAAAPERARLLRLAADWLAAYTAPRRESAGFGARHWARKTRATDVTHLSSADQMLASALIETIVKHALAARGCRLVRSVGHGDFVDINLIFDGQTLYGVDIQGARLLPVARMTARFLTWLQLQNSGPENTRECGLDKTDIDAFLGGELLTDDERANLLPVFIGDELLSRFCSEYHGHKHRARATAAIKAFIAAP